jgi:hypothetical protein
MDGSQLTDELPKRWISCKEAISVNVGMEMETVRSDKGFAAIKYG